MTNWPALTPTKPERLVTPCEFCGRELAITDGKIAPCKCQRGEAKP